MVIELDRLVDEKTKKYDALLAKESEQEHFTSITETDQYLLGLYEREKDNPYPKVYFNVNLPIEVKSKKFLIGYGYGGSSSGWPYSIHEFQSEIQNLQKKIERIEKLTKSESQSFINICLEDIRRVFVHILKKTQKLGIKDYLSVDFLREIGSSKDILEYEDNWDGEGSKKYKKDTWIKLNQFIINISKEFYLKYKKQIKTPYINPGMDGAIDLHWKTEKFELFLSFPERDDAPMTYYGDDYRDNIIKGTLKTNNFGVLISWIKTFH